MMKLRGLDDNMDIGGVSVPLPPGVTKEQAAAYNNANKPADPCVTGAGQPCFAMTADEKAYTTEAFMYRYFWVMRTYAFTSDGKLPEWLGQCWEQAKDINKARFNEDSPDIIFEDGRRITLFPEKVQAEFKARGGREVYNYINTQRSEGLKNNPNWIIANIINSEMSYLGFGVLRDMIGNTVGLKLHYFGNNRIGSNMVDDGYLGLKADKNRACLAKHTIGLTENYARYPDFKSDGVDKDTDYCYSYDANYYAGKGDGIDTRFLQSIANHKNEFKVDSSNKIWQHPGADLHYGINGITNRIGKLGRPIILHINRGDNVISSGTVWTYAIGLIAVAGAAVGLSAITGPLTSVASMAVAKGGKIGLSDLTKDPKLISGIAEAMLPQGSGLKDTINKAVAIQTGLSGINNNGRPDYTALLNATGINISSIGGAGYAPLIEEALKGNDLTTILSKGSNVKLDELGKIAQNIRNTSAPVDVQQSMKTWSELLKVIESGNVASSPQLMQTFEVNASGGMTGAIRMSGVDAMTGNVNHAIPVFLNHDDYLKIGKIDADRHNALIRLSQGLPTAQNIFDDQLVMSFENKLRGLSGTSDKTFVLPYGLPLEKRECFAKYLSCRGFNIVIGSPDYVKEEIKKPVVPKQQITKPAVTTPKKTVVTVKKEWK